MIPQLSITTMTRTAPTRVLVTGAGGAAAVAVLRALEGDGIELYAGDIDPHAAGLYLVPAERRLILPRGDAPDFKSHIQTTCRDLGIDVLVPTVDTELLPVARISAALRKAGTSPVVADEAALTKCLDKLQLLRCCDGVIPVPRSRPFDATFEEEAWTYPFIVKPRSGSGGRGVRLVHAAAQLSDIPRDGSHLVQEYLPGEEYSVDVFADQDGVVRAAVPRLRLKVDSGIAVAARTVHDDELERLARRVAERVRLSFVANVQFRRDAAGTPRLLEVNPRFPGTMPLTVEAGVPMPGLALQAALGFGDWPAELPFREVAVVRHWQEVYIEPAELDHAFGRESAAALEEVA